MEKRRDERITEGKEETGGARRARTFSAFGRPLLLLASERSGGTSKTAGFNITRMNICFLCRVYR